MIVSINQPAYLPWLGYFDRIARSDLHVVLDHVQFEKNSMTNRNQVRAGEEARMLTVPVRTAGRFGRLPINEIEIVNDTPWARKHWQAIQQNYSRSAFFAEHAAFFRGVYEETWERLLPLIRRITGYMLEQLGIGTRLVSSAELGVPGSKSELVLNLCRHLGATVYLSGPLGRDYLDRAAFQEAGIEVLFQDYEHPEYSQRLPGFVPRLSAIDLLFNHGPASQEILGRGHRVAST